MAVQINLINATALTVPFLKAWFYFRRTIESVQPF